MREAIKVHVVNKGRATLYMRYRCPDTGQEPTRSTKLKLRTPGHPTASEWKDAEREAAKWEEDLREGRYKAPSRITWEEFRERYESEVLPGLAPRTGDKIMGVLNSVERLVSPHKLSSLNADRLSQFQSLRRGEGVAETTISGELAHLQAALRWAHELGMLIDLPKIKRLRRAKKKFAGQTMKGRPITGEEFERMLAKVPEGLRFSSRYRGKPTPAKWKRRKPAAARKPTEIPAHVVESWRRYLRGLWLSGLRLSESLELYWDRDDRLRVDLDGRFAMLRIPAELEKGHKDRLLPIAPEFAEFLQATPEDERTGRVFRPLAVREDAPLPGPDRAMKVIAAIGRAAGVKVHTHPTSGKVKHASAHDLRRSFGERWASRVMPHHLQELMRHESIETTLKFYVGRNAETTAAALYAAVSTSAGDNSGDRAADSSSADSGTMTQTDAYQRA